MKIMEKLITAFPQNMLDALAIAEAHSFKQPKADIHNIVICGMGGSGIGGKIVSQWVQKEAKIPVLLLQDYDLPNFVNEHSLVIGSSYSGNTEETLAGVKEAKERGAHIIGITSGGEMHSFCLENNYDVVIVPGGNPPRSATAFSIVQLINIFVQLGIIGASNLAEIRNSYDLLINESASIHTLGKEVANFLFGKVGVIYASPQYEAVAIRARQQFNENSKYLSWHHTIPEMNHNELVGWGGGDERFKVLMLHTNDMNPRNQKRYDITKEIISKKAAGIMEIEAIGNTQIEKSFYLIHLVDWASYYLCDLNKADIMDIKVIDFLKDELSKF
jgi:glucose/mannose-6-phosphate isomerase